MYNIHPPPPPLRQIAVGAGDLLDLGDQREKEPDYIRLRRLTKDMLYPEKVLKYLDALMRIHSKPDYTWAYALGGFGLGLVATLGVIVVMDVLTPEPTGVVVMDLITPTGKEKKS